MEVIHVILADDHPVVRAGIRHELQAAGIEVSGEASDGETALAMVERLHPDVLVLDMEMPGFDGLEVTRRLRNTPSAPPILVLSAYDNSNYVFGLLEAGALGYVLKDEALETIVMAVHAAARGQPWLSPRIAAKVMRRLNRKETGLNELTARELEVLQHIARGYSNPQIAQTLGICEGTVKNHVTNIYTKLNLHMRSEVVAWAWKHGLVNRE